MKMHQNQVPTGATLVQPGVERHIAAIVDRGDQGHLVPGTHVTMDELHRYQLLGRQLQARAMAGALEAAFAGLLRGVSRPFEKAAGALGRARREGAAIRSLGALDDHILADIGITREQIPAAVAGLLERPTAAPKPPTAAPVPTVDLPAACNDDHLNRAA
jgi:uncharacterized protein YjiS (DUF1127 family)